MKRIKKDLNHIKIKDIYDFNSALKCAKNNKISFEDFECELYSTLMECKKADIDIFGSKKDVYNYWNEHNFINDDYCYIDEDIKMLTSLKKLNIDDKKLIVFNNETNELSTFKNFMEVTNKYLTVEEFQDTVKRLLK